MPRSIWSGHISFGLVEIPVGVVSAVDKADKISFKQLTADDHAPVGYKRVNKHTGEEVDYGDIVKGYELDDGSYVILTKDEIAEAHPEATSTIDIFAFVDEEQIGHAYYDAPYYLVPGGKKKKRAKAYALLRETLRDKDKVALAKVVLRTRQYLAALFPEDGAIMMQTLRWGHQLRSAEALELPPADLDELGVTDQERQLAEMLVDNLEADFEPETYSDDYRDRILEYIHARAEQGEVSRPEAAAAGGEPGEVVDIMDLLKKSVEEAKKGKKAG